ncbi:acyl-CoA dehydrogenase family protein [Nocardia vinacea]|uniref:acyl-CoA dehydrogenase family protein n=1 Tax=Nocardia vinacea TaxID=96468 RepID=UPI00342C4BD5
MDFTRDESQEAVAELVVSLLEHDSARGFALWPKLVDRGLVSAALPKRYGGGGLGLLEVSAMLTELATDAIEVPALTTLGFGVLPLTQSAPEPLAKKVFSAVAEGSVLTAAFNEPGAPFAMKPETAAVTDGDTVRIRGHKVGVPYADRARWILVPTDSGLAVVDADAPSLERVESPSSTGVPEFSLYLNDAEIPAEQLLSGGILELHRFALASIGSVADGLLTGALTLTTTDVGLRHLSRASVLFRTASRKLADVSVVSRALHAITVSANWALAQEDDSAEHRERIDNDLDLLAYYVAFKLPAAIQECYRLHRGIGIGAAHPLHRYYSQAKDIARWLGGESFRLDQLGARCSSI